MGSRPEWVTDLIVELKTMIREEVTVLIEANFHQIRENQEKIQEENMKIRKENQELKESCRRLETRVLRLETCSNRANIEIEGVHVAEDERPELIVGDIAKLVQYPLAQGHILKAYRVGKSRNVNGITLHPKIVVELRNPKVQEEFLDKAREYWRKKDWKVSENSLLGSGGDANISIRRQLSHEMKFLFAKAKETAKKKNYKYTWISKYGNLLIRESENSRPIHIECVDDLRNLNRRSHDN